MVLIIDISNPFQKKAGFHKASFKSVNVFRVWWLWFAVTYCSLGQFEYEEHIASGNTVWIGRTK